MWNGGALRRFTPHGQQDAVVPLPVSRPTSCAFGGPDMSELYVTTASIDLTDAERAAQPLAGRLLRLRPGPVGLPSTTAHAAPPQLTASPAFHRPRHPPRRALYPGPFTRGEPSSRILRHSRCAEDGGSLDTLESA